MTIHTFRCPKCGTTVQVRTLHADAYVAATCQASTYCASRGVLMELRPCDSGPGTDTLDRHTNDPGTPASAPGLVETCKEV